MIIHKFSIIVFMLLIMSFPLQAADVNKKVKDQAEALYRDIAKNDYDSKITQIIPRTVSRRLQEFCKPYQLFSVGIPVPEDKQIFFTPATVFFNMASANDAVSVSGISETIAFLI